MNPVAQRDGLTVRELGSETLVYDTALKKVHALNAVSAWVWQRCDGTRTHADLAAEAARTFHVPAADSLVALALQQLERRGLVQTGSAPPAPAAGAARTARREALKQLAALAAGPLILSVLAPKAMAHHSTSECPPGTPTDATAACVGLPAGAPCSFCLESDGAASVVSGICSLTVPGGLFCIPGVGA